MGSIKIKGATSGSMVLTVPDTGADNVPVDVAGLLSDDSIRISGSGHDFDNLAKTGTYNLYNISAAPSAPPFSYGTMMVVGSNKAGGTFVTQTAIERISGTVYVRGMNDTGTTWYGWKKQVSEDSNQICKAWVNFNGNDFNIRNSFNVSSITDLGTGNYYIMFATNMVNNTYTVSCSSGHDWASANDYLSSASKDRFTNKCNVTVTYGHYQGHGGAYGDLTQNDVQIFGD